MYENQTTKKIAIVGSGISGLTTLYALRDTKHEIHLFEASDRIGGHTNTVLWKNIKSENNATSRSNQNGIPVDTGFIVLNMKTYPNFRALLKTLDVPIVPTLMTFAVSQRDAGNDNIGLEWSGTSLNSLFAQRKNLFNFSFWRMLFDVWRFNTFAEDFLRYANAQDTSTSNLSSITINEYLVRGRYSSIFRDNYLLPLTASIWSTGAEKCALHFPAVTLIRFLANHGLLNTFSARPTWLTIPGGSDQYVKRILQACPQVNIRLSSGVCSIDNSVDNNTGRANLTLTIGDTSSLNVDANVEFNSDPTVESVESHIHNHYYEQFDIVILACHGDTAARIIKSSATPRELEVLQSFETSNNVAYLHNDTRLMPHLSKTWAAWNYLYWINQSESWIKESGEDSVTVTYDLSLLQHLPLMSPDNSPILVTLNPPPHHTPLNDRIQKILHYQHPLYTEKSIKAQSELNSVQGIRGIYYTGAWTRYGFHEDGVISGINVACGYLNGSVPWIKDWKLFTKRNEPSVKLSNIFGFISFKLRCCCSFFLILFIRLLEFIFRHIPGAPRPLHSHTSVGHMPNKTKVS